MDAVGAPQSAVGVIIALLVLLPETLAAVPQRRRDRVQTSLNLGLGSAMASIGLTIPAIAVASIWLDGAAGARPRRHADRAAGHHRSCGQRSPCCPGRATLQEGGVHLVLFGAFLFLAINP